MTRIYVHYHVEKMIRTQIAYKDLLHKVGEFRKEAVSKSVWSEYKGAKQRLNWNTLDVTYLKMCDGL